ncbi:MAG: rhodanese-like domain-containing protein [Hyphomicrobiales bacterium]|nr:rhodanese-like domain-containing protein [Hyphomicrobiales bacterium]
MFKTLKDFLSAATNAVPRISPADTQKMIKDEGAVMIDVRELNEVANTGKAAGALHISRGMLEFKADPSSPMFEKSLSKDKPVILYCASGGRSSLAGKSLKDMGYEKVYNLGSIKDWIEAGGVVEHPLDSGM